MIAAKVCYGYGGILIVYAATMEDSITPTEFFKVVDYFLDFKNTGEWTYLDATRQRFDILALRDFIARGQMTRLIRLSEMGVEELNEEGVQGTFALRISSRQGKVNQFGNVQTVSCLR